MAFTSIDLTKNKWQYREYPLEARTMQDLDEKLWYDAVVPGSIYLSLIDTGHIQQDQICQYPENFQWVHEKPWIYKTFFDVSKSLAESQKIEIIFNMLDTYSSIWINGKLIGKTNNCFIPQRFDITELIKTGQNSLMVKFEPPVETARNISQKYGPLEGTAVRNDYRLYSRKPQYSFGWDFCPQLPGCGILDSAKLEFSNSARISNLHIRTVDCNQHYADVKVSLELEKFFPNDLDCEIEISGTGLKLTENLSFKKSDNKNSIVFHIERPFLWWPKGYGIQYLYDIKIKILRDGKTIDTHQQKFGIRTIKLQQLPDDHGKSFQFIVNGQPVKIKGANWVPVSILGDQTQNDYTRLIEMASQANFNMLRVWGGGCYEREIFYQLCDIHGILVWQDFMFACAQYPQQKWFLETITNEAQITVKRLRNHPCIALWCGNNQCQWMHKKGLIGKNNKFSGAKIFDRILPEIIEHLNCDTDYIPTTPFTSEKDFDDPSAGTIHQWDIWTADKDILEYILNPAPRFTAEFGLQSIPELSSLSRFVPNDKLRTASYEIEKLNRNNFRTNGNSKLYRYTFDAFAPTSDLEHLIYFSQITQARAIKLYTEHMRINGNINSGSLYWQFNDCSPAISWSSVDNFASPKALYYYARRFYRPVIIALNQKYDRNDIDSPLTITGGEIILVNDLSKSVTGEIACHLCNLYGKTLDSFSIPITLTPHSQSLPNRIPEDFIKNQNRLETYLHLKLIVEGKIYAENLYLLTKDKYINWPASKINWEIKQTDDQTAQLNLNSDVLVKDLKICGLTPDRLSENYFDLIPAVTKTITVKTNQTDIEQKIKFLSVNSIFNKKAPS